MRYAGEKRFNGWTALTLVLLALFLLFVIYPIGMLLIKSLFTGGKIDLSYFVKFFTKKYYWGALVNSFKVTVVSTLVASLIGVPMAYLLRSVKIRGAGLINILIVISYLSPPFIGAYSWIQLLGRNGFITRIANALFGVKLPGIYGFAGIVLVFSLQSFPLIYMYVSGAMKNLDNSLNEAAESLGCNAFQRVTKIIFPLVMPSLLAGALLVFMRVFADFGTPMIIGEGYKTFPVMLYTQFMGEVGTNDGFAATMCLIVIVIALMFGGGILAAGEKGKLAKDMVSSLYAVIERVMAFVISLSPIGVFTMMTWVVATQGPEILGSLAVVLGCAYLGYIVHAVLCYSFSAKAFAGISPFTFFEKASPAMIFAFTSTSSAATIPLSKECADELGADIFEITPVTPYTSADLDWTTSGSRVNREHDNEALRDIALTRTTPANWDEYDTVFIGYPIWWGIAAWPVNNFVKDNDFTGKTVIPLATSASSGIGQSGTLLEEMVGGGTWQSGQRFSSGVSSSTVRDWAAGLGL